MNEETITQKHLDAAPISALASELFPAVKPDMSETDTMALILLSLGTLSAKQVSDRVEGCNHDRARHLLKTHSEEIKALRVIAPKVRQAMLRSAIDNVIATCLQVSQTFKRSEIATPFQAKAFADFGQSLQKLLEGQVQHPDDKDKRPVQDTKRAIAALDTISE